MPRPYERSSEPQHAVSSTAPAPIAGPSAIERVVSSRQCDVAAATLAAAFLDYPLMVEAAPAIGPRRRGVASLYSSILRDTCRYGETWLAESRAGVACWLPPETSTPGLVRQIRCGMWKLPLRFGWSGFRCLEDYDRVARRLHHRYAPRPHWYLAAIGVAPDRQGQGFGSRLLQAMLQRPEVSPFDCYLETHSQSNVALYQKHGFVVCEQTTPRGYRTPIWAMLRPASLPAAACAER